MNTIRDSIKLNSKIVRKKYIERKHLADLKTYETHIYTPYRSLVPFNVCQETLPATVNVFTHNSYSGKYSKRAYWNLLLRNTDSGYPFTKLSKIYPPLHWATKMSYQFDIPLPYNSATASSLHFFFFFQYYKEFTSSFQVQEINCF